MEKFMQHENGVMGCAHLAHPIALPKLPNAVSEDMNFSDVFGGPPRRLSIQDVKLRYSFGETHESEEETVSARWSSLGEKPVFGEEILPRRQHHQGGDFFDDIFRGDQSCNSPRRTDIRDRDRVFRSNPGSRILSPAWPLPPMADPFGTSAPTQFSLPAKQTKGLESSAITSNGQHKIDDSITNGLSSSLHSPSFLSRFSSPVFRSEDEYRQSPLSHELPFNSQDSSSDRKENGENSKKDRGNIDGFAKNFHFSIYKWAGREVPMLLPVVGRNKVGTLDGNKYDRSASYNGRIKSRSSSVPKRQSMLAREPNGVKNGYVEDLIQNKEVTQEQKISIEYTELHETLEPKWQSQISEVTQKIQGQENSVDEVDVQKKADKKMKEESSRSKMKPLHSFLRDKSDAQRNSDKKVLPKKKESLQSKHKPLDVLLGDEVEQQVNVSEIKQSKKKILNGIHTSSHEAKTLKKNEGAGILSNNGNVDKSNLQPPGMDLGENRVRGKVREYVQIFNQEADSRPKVDLQRSRSSRWKAADTVQKDSAVDSNAEHPKEEDNFHNVVKMPETSIKADENLKNNEAQRYSPAKFPCDTNNHSINQENGFLSETSRSDSMTFGENADDFLEYDFLVQELSEDHVIVTKSEDPNDTKAIDSKIRQWSFGKKGNIRSLLSTLQFVLWPESGWKPVPLADLIESNAVKRAYQKALLRLHPDKLQQKGAAFHQKYIAEKVFDILQEAWDQFNVLVPV